MEDFRKVAAVYFASSGEGWLIFPDLAVLNTRPTHGKAQDADDPLHAARAAEVTSLWRLGARQPPA